MPPPPIASNPRRSPRNHVPATTTIAVAIVNGQCRCDRSPALRLIISCHRSIEQRGVRSTAQATFDLTFQDPTLLGGRLCDNLLRDYRRFRADADPLKR